jgi:hypothetical protein
MGGRGTALWLAGCCRLLKLLGLVESLEVLEPLEVLKLHGKQVEGHGQILLWK